MKRCYNDSNFDKLKELGDIGRLNNDQEKKDLYGGTGWSENKKYSEINQEKIENKNIKIKNYPTPKENEKKMNENFLKLKIKIYRTPKENEKKIN